MESNKAYILYNLNKELIKYKKSAKILKIDVINNNIISNFHQLKKINFEKAKIQNFMNIWKYLEGE